ncbi:hypothetical protein HDU98_008151 [Podochytrium sp. JEL0797]|nr:hypothetical protein HDU98_008151 [Podochytrium sp. JEL0797]
MDGHERHEDPNSPTTSETKRETTTTSTTSSGVETTTKKVTTAVISEIEEIHEGKGGPVVETNEATFVGEHGEIVKEFTITETHQVTSLKPVEVVVEEEVKEYAEEEGELDITWLAGEIRSNSGIAALELIDDGLSTEEVVLLCEAMQVNITVEKLDLQGNMIQGEGLAALIAAISINQHLRELRIGQQEMSEEDELALAMAVIENHHLIVFDYVFRTESIRIRVKETLARNEITHSRRNIKTIYVSETTEVTTTKKNREVVKTAQEIADELAAASETDIVAEEEAVAVGDVAVEVAEAVVSEEVEVREAVVVSEVDPASVSREIVLEAEVEPVVGEASLLSEPVETVLEVPGEREIVLEAAVEPVVAETNLLSEPVGTVVEVRGERGIVVTDAVVESDPTEIFVGVPATDAVVESVPREILHSEVFDAPASIISDITPIYTPTVVETLPVPEEAGSTITIATVTSTVVEPSAADIPRGTLEVESTAASVEPRGISVLEVELPAFKEDSIPASAVTSVEVLESTVLEEPMVQETAVIEEVVVVESKSCELLDGDAVALDETVVVAQEEPHNSTFLERVAEKVGVVVEAVENSFADLVSHAAETGGRDVETQETATPAAAEDIQMFALADGIDEPRTFPIDEVVSESVFDVPQHPIVEIVVDGTPREIFAESDAAVLTQVSPEDGTAQASVPEDLNGETADIVGSVPSEAVAEPAEVILVEEAVVEQVETIVAEEPAVVVEDKDVVIVEDVVVVEEIPQHKAGFFERVVETVEGAVDAVEHAVSDLLSHPAEPIERDIEVSVSEVAASVEPVLATEVVAPVSREISETITEVVVTEATTAAESTPVVSDEPAIETVVEDVSVSETATVSTEALEPVVIVESIEVVAAEEVAVVEQVEAIVVDDPAVDVENKDVVIVEEVVAVEEVPSHRAGFFDRVAETVGGAVEAVEHAVVDFVSHPAEPIERDIDTSVSEVAAPVELLVATEVVPPVAREISETIVALKESDFETYEEFVAAQNAASLTVVETAVVPTENVVIPEPILDVQESPMADAPQAKKRGFFKAVFRQAVPKKEPIVTTTTTVTTVAGSTEEDLAGGLVSESIEARNAIALAEEESFVAPVVADMSRAIYVAELRPDESSSTEEVSVCIVEASPTREPTEPAVAEGETDQLVGAPEVFESALTAREIDALAGSSLDAAGAQVLVPEIIQQQGPATASPAKRGFFSSFFGQSTPSPKSAATTTITTTTAIPESVVGAAPLEDAVAEGETIDIEPAARDIVSETAIRVTASIEAFDSAEEKEIVVADVSQTTAKSISFETSVAETAIPEVTADVVVEEVAITETKELEIEPVTQGVVVESEVQELVVTETIEAVLVEEVAAEQVQVVKTEPVAEMSKDIEVAVEEEPLVTSDKDAVILEEVAVIEEVPSHKAGFFERVVETVGGAVETVEHAVSDLLSHPAETKERGLDVAVSGFAAPVETVVEASEIASEVVVPVEREISETTTEVVVTEVAAPVADDRIVAELKESDFEMYEDFVAAQNAASLAVVETAVVDKKEIVVIETSVVETEDAVVQEAVVEAFSRETVVETVVTQESVEEVDELESGALKKRGFFKAIFGRAVPKSESIETITTTVTSSDVTETIVEDSAVAETNVVLADEPAIETVEDVSVVETVTVSTEVFEPVAIEETAVESTEVVVAEEVAVEQVEAIVVEEPAVVVVDKEVIIVEEVVAVEEIPQHQAGFFERVVETVGGAVEAVEHAVVDFVSHPAETSERGIEVVNFAATDKPQIATEVDVPVEREFSETIAEVVVPEAAAPEESEPVVAALKESDFETYEEFVAAQNAASLTVVETAAVETAVAETEETIVVETTAVETEEAVVQETVVESEVVVETITQESVEEVDESESDAPKKRGFFKAIFGRAAPKSGSVEITTTTIVTSTDVSETVVEDSTAPEKNTVVSGEPAIEKIVEDVSVVETVTVLPEVVEPVAIEETVVESTRAVVAEAVSAEQVETIAVEDPAVVIENKGVVIVEKVVAVEEVPSHKAGFFERVVETVGGAVEAVEHAVVDFVSHPTETSERDIEFVSKFLITISV